MEKKHRISLLFNYSYTINLFLDYCYDLLKRTRKEYINKYAIFHNIHKLNSILLGYFITSYYFNTLYNLNYIIMIILYWIGLGIMSTIGFGFGIQTGLLFLMPYTIGIYNKAIECGNTNFNLVFNQILICSNTTSIHEDYIIYYVFFKTLPFAILWGIGTAIGELPPYYLAINYKNNILYKNNDNKKNKFINKIIYYKNKFKNNYYLKTAKKYYFLSIIIMASWPNITFDMCGFICGYYTLTIYEFLIPTIIGKALIKAPIQIFFVLYIYKYNIDNIDNIIFKSNKTYINYITNIIIFVLIFYFIKTSIENIAENMAKSKIQNI